MNNIPPPADPCGGCGQPLNPFHGYVADLHGDWHFDCWLRKRLPHTDLTKKLAEIIEDPRELTTPERYRAIMGKAHQILRYLGLSTPHEVGEMKDRRNAG